MARESEHSPPKTTLTSTSFQPAPIPPLYSESREFISQHVPPPVLSNCINRCNRQISAAELLVKDAEVTRSTVQKAVVVLASKPVFGLIR